MSSWSPQEYVSGCWISAYQYEGPWHTKNGHEFMIHATLEPGADEYFSGIRLLIGCKDTQEGEFAELAVRDNLGLDTMHGQQLESDSEQENKEKYSLLVAQQNGCKLAEQWQEDTNDTRALPLCTLVFEIVSESNESWNRATLMLHPPEAAAPQPLRTLYNYVELCTPSSRSLVLFLSINNTFRGSLKPSNPLGVIHKHPASLGIMAQGVHILPPSPSRKSFIDLPSELLHLIFEQVVADKSYSNWRMELVSLALVCRAWRLALDHMFRDFGQYSTSKSRPSALRLAGAIEMNPELGKKIRTFNTGYFRSEGTRLDFARAIVTIFHSATMVTVLQVTDTHTEVAEDFVQALCRSPDVRDFALNRGPLSTGDWQNRYRLSVADILQCMAHWPRLHKITLFSFSASSDVDNLFNPACSIKELILCQGRIWLPQLRLLTSSSHSSLQRVVLQHISGLTNEGLRTWLVEIAPTLTTFSVEFCPLSRQPDEEYAVDALLPRMVNLIQLDLDGDVASELVLLRYALPVSRPEQLTPYQRRGTGISISNAPAVNPHGLVKALQSTEWRAVSVKGLALNEELRAEAKKIARDRQIFLLI